MIKKQPDQGVQVIKATGELEPFSWQKVYQSIRKAGGSENIAEQVADQLQKETHNKVSSTKISQRVKGILAKKDLKTSMKFDLPRAIRRLGPTGFPFEEYIRSIYRKMGFKTKRGKWLKGKCVEHEVDFLAWNDKYFYIGECKYHNKKGIKGDLPQALHYFARFYDLEKGHFCQRKAHNRQIKTILVTNTEFTSKAIKYFKCMGRSLWSWDYPPHRGLKDIIDEEKVYPVTILPSFTGKKLMRAFMKEKLLLAEDVFDINKKKLVKKYNIYPKKISSLVQEAAILFKNNH